MQYSVCPTSSCTIVVIRLQILNSQLSFIQYFLSSPPEHLVHDEKYQFSHSWSGSSYSKLRSGFWPTQILHFLPNQSLNVFRCPSPRLLLCQHGLYTSQVCFAGDFLGLISPWRVWSLFGIRKNRTPWWSWYAIQVLFRPYGHASDSLLLILHFTQPILMWLISSSLVAISLLHFDECHNVAPRIWSWQFTSPNVSISNTVSRARPTIFLFVVASKLQIFYGLTWDFMSLRRSAYFFPAVGLISVASEWVRLFYQISLALSFCFFFLAFRHTFFLLTLSFVFSTSFVNSDPRFCYFTLRFFSVFE